MPQVAFPSYCDSSTRSGFSVNGDSRDADYILDWENRLLRVLEEANFDELLLFSPLLLLGPSGVGKSVAACHLLNRLRLDLAMKDSGTDFLLITGADFHRSYAAAVHTDSLDEWRKRLNTRVLFLDGLHDIAGKFEAQRELRCLIDEFHLQQKLLIIASSDPVNALKDFDPSVSSRLVGGLSIPLSYPAKAARVEYLTQVSQSLNIQFRPDAMQRLADSASGSFLVLRNAVNQIKSCLPSGCSVVDMPAIDAFITASANPIPSIKEIVAEVANCFLVKKADLIGPSRKQSIVRARGVAIYLTRTLSDLSLENIGASLGKRDHTTILHAYRKTEKLMESDVELKDAVTGLMDRLQR